MSNEENNKPKNEYQIFVDVDDSRHFIVVPKTKHSYLTTQYIVLNEVEEDLKYILQDDILSDFGTEPRIKMHTTHKTLVSSIELFYDPS